MADSNQETKWRDELEGSSQKSWTRIRTIESLDQSQKSESSGSYPRYRWSVLGHIFSFARFWNYLGPGLQAAAVGLLIIMLLFFLVANLAN
jgi:hypothetical protein